MKYTLKKFVSMIVTLVVVSVCVFLAFNILPGDPAVRMLGLEASPELIAQTREQMGLNDPFIVRYFRWFTAFVRGDFGTSYSYSVPVAGMIANKIPITLTMGLMAFVITVLISIPLGIVTAKYENGVLDRIINVSNQIVMAIPPFFSGIIITFLFGLILKLFTPGGFVSYTEDVGRFARYLFFPSLAVALPKISMTVKMLRGSLIDEAGRDYTRTAYSRGKYTSVTIPNTPKQCSIFSSVAISNIIICFVLFLVVGVITNRKNSTYKYQYGEAGCLKRVSLNPPNCEFTESAKILFKTHVTVEKTK